MIKCKKLGIMSEGFENPPYPGPLGVRLMNEISKQAFEMWKNHQTMLINEYRLNLAEPKARGFLKDEMEKFFFGEGSSIPKGFVPAQKD